MASIIFSAPRCSDLPDLLQVRNLFAAKYGKEFIAAASELRPDTSVNRRVSRLGPFSIYFSLSLRNFIWYNLCNLQIIEKLSVSAPPADVKLNLLKAIALEYNVNWDSTKTEQEFSKKPEDLLVRISFRLFICSDAPSTMPMVLWAFQQLIFIHLKLWYSSFLIVLEWTKTNSCTNSPRLKARSSETIVNYGSVISFLKW